MDYDNGFILQKTVDWSLLNDNSTNIIIISPNYHRIIHKNNPHFNRKQFQFEFPHGKVLRLQLYEHLKV